jgi:hypothetical protein
MNRLTLIDISAVLYWAVLQIFVGLFQPGYSRPVAVDATYERLFPQISGAGRRSLVREGRLSERNV